MPSTTEPTAPADATVPRRWASKRIVLRGAAAAVLLAAASTFAFAAGRGAFSGSPTCTVPSLSGTVVEVTAVDMVRMNRGGMMNGRRDAMPTMRLFATPATVPAGGVSLLVRNAGSRTHELVVLQLAPGRYELVCDETDHYAQGMWTQLVVT